MAPSSRGTPTLARALVHLCLVTTLAPASASAGPRLLPAMAAQPASPGIISEKLRQKVLLFLPRNSRTLARLDDVKQLDAGYLEAIRARTGIAIKGLIFDVDGTLGPTGRALPPSSIEYLRRLRREGIRTIIFSNIPNHPRYAAIPDIPVLRGVPDKPALEGFAAAARQLGLQPSQVAMVGDNYLTDGAAIRAGMSFIKIRAIHDAGHHSLRHLPHRFARWFYDSFLPRFHPAPIMDR